MKLKGNIFKTHKIAVIIIISLVMITGVGIGVFYYLSEQSIAQQKEDHAAHMKELDRQHEQIKKQVAERKAAEEAAKKKAAEEKARKEAESKKSGATAKAPKAKNCKADDAHSNPNSIAVVVNKKRCFSPLSFAPSDLTTVNGATISAKAASDFAKMVKAVNKYTKKGGTTLSVTSSYRSYSSQVSTYNYWVGVNGSAASADKVSARPGYSEHQTGLAIDLAVNNYGKNKKKCVLECFANTKQYKWLAKNAAAYGFIERYPKGLTSITGYSPEAWHWRYVGSTVALDMKAKGIKTLEQYWGLKGGDY